VKHIDWDAIEIRWPERNTVFSWAPRRTIELPCPFGATRTDNETLFAGDRSIEDIVSELADANPVGAESVRSTVC
jgi:hypothetical protein